MTRFAILLDGPCHPGTALREAMQGARVIAADGGMRHAGPLGLTPELWVGDFDGTPDDLLAGNSTPREAYPTAKDATDGEIAVEAALSRGASELVMVGSLGGGRVDHALGLVTLAVATAHAHGVTVALTDGRQWALPLLPGRPVRLARPGRVVSVIGLSDLSGLTLSGVRWALDGADIPLGSSRTLSNEAVGPVHATLRAGRAVLVHGPGDGAPEPSA